MQHKITIAIVLSVFIFCLVGCSQGEILLDKSQSSYSDFWIYKDKVYIKCELNLKNTSSFSKKAKFTADLDKDKEGGLLKQSHLKGYTQDLHSDVFTLKSGYNEDVAVVFVGDFGGKNQKRNRLLPTIHIETIH